MTQVSFPCEYESSNLRAPRLVSVILRASSNSLRNGPSKISAKRDDTHEGALMQPILIRAILRVDNDVDKTAIKAREA
jgi:hypothetical protein